MFRILIISLLPTQFPLVSPNFSLKILSQALGTAFRLLEMIEVDLPSDRVIREVMEELYLIRLLKIQVIRLIRDSGS